MMMVVMIMLPHRTPFHQHSDSAGIGYGYWVQKLYVVNKRPVHSSVQYVQYKHNLQCVQAINATGCQGQ